MTIEVNYLAVLLAGVVSMVLGFLWYSPIILGKPWMKERGFTAESMKKAQKEMGKLYGVSFVVSLITAYVLSHVMTLSMSFFRYDALTAGFSTAFFMWLGFVMPVQLTGTIFSDKKNWKLLAIDTGYQLVSLLGMGVVLSML
ncbi:MAG: hypothetical protein RLZZ455_113 [Candidatus Parcubacteria bacterium]|jgi:hypothetical protein